MQLNGYTVSIEGAIEEQSDGYVLMKHGQQYAVRLHNHHKQDGNCKPCDAEVFIDGKSCGIFRVSYGQMVYIEHPIYDNGKFTAYKKGTQEGNEAKLTECREELGLIEVVFHPGVHRAKSVCPPTIIYNYPIIWREPCYPYYVPCDPVPQPWIPWYYNQPTCTTVSSFNTTAFSVSSDTVQLSSAGMGLSGYSNQHFDSVEELWYDEPVSTISLRIVSVDDQAVRPLNQNRDVYQVEKRDTGSPRPL